MTKYRLEYIWLDGYTPFPICAAKRRSRNSTAFRRSNSFRCGALTAARPCRRRAAARTAYSNRSASSRTPAQERRPGSVRSHDAGRRHAARHRTSAPRSSMTKALGSVSSRSISSTRMAAHSASQKPAIRHRRARTTPASATTNVGKVAREIVEEHLDLCLAAGINHEGINAEVAKGQWEFQIFGKGSKRAADEMWMARYLLHAAHREIRHRHRVPLQAARRHRLERLRHARQLLDHLYARSRRQGLLREADGRLREGRARTTSRSMDPTITAADRQARDAVDRHRSATVLPTAAHRSACRTASSRTTTRAISKTAARTRKATRTRSPRRS